MSALRELAEGTYISVMRTMTSNTGIAAIESALKAAVADAAKHPCSTHETTLTLALERVKRLEEALRAMLECGGACQKCEAIARAALRPEGT